MTTENRTHRIIRFRRWIDPVFDQTISAQSGLELTVLPYDKSPAEVRELLADASVLQVSAARDEVPAQWHASESLIALCPRLLCVSASGAGYDTIDVDACTRAGVLVARATDGHAGSVALAEGRCELEALRAWVAGRHTRGCE